MSQSSSPKAPSTNYPEFAVRAETIRRFFHPPLPRSTFHDLFNKGKILRVKGLRGFYLLNASLKRLGLREVPSLPKEPPARAFVDGLNFRNPDHAKRLVAMLRQAIEALQSIQEKIAYSAEVLDALDELDAMTKPEG